MWPVFAQCPSELVLAVNDLWREEKGRVEEEEQQELGDNNVHDLSSCPLFLGVFCLSIIEDFSLLFFTNWRKKTTIQNISQLIRLDCHTSRSL